MTRRIIPIAFAAVALTAACNSDSALSPSRQNDMVGTWISAGSDVSIGLSTTMRAAMVKATFRADSTYSIELTDSTHSVIRYSGTWSASGSQQSVRSITLTQISPSASVEQGVFQVAGARLTYEVVRTQPAVDGFTAATVAAGFGSTARDGETHGSTWIQRFWNADADMITPPCNPNDSLSVIAKRPCEGHQWTAETDKGR